ncbi:V-type ATP synthase subunit E [Clostridiaceae bacterium HSG29]|nr:V-type ATP synthase subunit E [Clostridiaceae bacterium HSG29]
MITIEDKIELFRKIVLDKINGDFKEINNYLEDEKKIEDIKIEKDAIDKSKSYINKFVKKANEEKERAVIEANKNSKEKILEIKNKFIDEVYQSLLETCSVFMDDNSYLSIFEKLANNVKDAADEFEEIKIYLLKKDFDEKLSDIQEIFKRIFTEKEINYYISEYDFKGGFILYNGDESVKLNVSLESIVSYNRIFIGNEVHKLLEVDGETDE